MFGKLRDIKSPFGKSLDSKAMGDIKPYTFGCDYEWPNLFTEADEMLQLSLLIYIMTDLRILAKKKENGLTTPEKILTLPLSLETMAAMIAENLEQIKEAIGDSDHDMTMSALHSIQKRLGSTNSVDGRKNWVNLFTTSDDNSVETTAVVPTLVAYGDDNPNKELVYAIAVAPARKRITVAFRGSVTPTDFMTDASISFQKIPNPLKDAEHQDEKLGIHSGFYDYLLRPTKKGSSTKYDEILQVLRGIFQDKRYREYKLYVTGHSLGGALATLFSFEAAAASTDSSYGIPSPVTCVSVASPRVGNTSFQRSFRLLEERGVLRHLRIANDKDPVTIMPKASSKKILSMLSPISYIAFKISDKKFADNETYQHTGIKLKMMEGLEKDGSGDLYELAYSSCCQKIVTEEKSASSWLSTCKDRAPIVQNHFGDIYAQRMAKLKEALTGYTLNELYQSKAAAALATSIS